MRSHWKKAIVATALLALLAAFTGTAFARTAGYTGDGVKLQAGQSQGAPILIGLDLVGNGCPSGPRCFKNAKVENLSAVSWAYPNCPEILDSAFALHMTARVSKGSRHFHLSGPNFNYAQDQVVVDGSFSKAGKKATGWFTVEDAGCSTGQIFWVAKPD